MSRVAPQPVRVLLVDDQPLVRMGHALVLDTATDITVVGEGSDGRVALSLVDERRPDVVIMDVRMPRMDGIEATRLITGRHPRTRVIVFTTYDLDECAFGGLQAGAQSPTDRSASSGIGAAGVLRQLTPREYDIFVAVAGGLSNPEICAHFHLSAATVKTHINRIFAKLDLRDRVQAVILAYELGVAPDTEKRSP